MDAAGETAVRRMTEKNFLLRERLDYVTSVCKGCSRCSQRLQCTIKAGLKPTPPPSDCPERVLMERIREMEAERAMLRLENEHQRNQYERCLDEISARIVEAIVSQRDLLEECSRLHKRVTELDAQNREILAKFRQRFHGIQFSSAPALQTHQILETQHPFTMTSPSSGRMTSHPDRIKSWHGDQLDLDPNASIGLDPDLRLTDSLDEHIGQVLRLTKQLTCMTFDKMESMNGSETVTLTSTKYLLDDRLSPEDDEDSAVHHHHPQSLLSDGESSDQNDPDSWDVDQADCCSASLSDLLDEEEVMHDEMSDEEVMSDRHHPINPGIDQVLETAHSTAGDPNFEPRQEDINSIRMKSDGVRESSNRLTLDTSSKIDVDDVTVLNHFFASNKLVSGQSSGCQSAPSNQNCFFHTYPRVSSKAAPHQSGSFDPSHGDNSAAKIKRTHERFHSYPPSFGIDCAAALPFYRKSNTDIHNYLEQMGACHGLVDAQNHCPRIVPVSGYGSSCDDPPQRSSWPPSGCFCGTTINWNEQTGTGRSPHPHIAMNGSNISPSRTISKARPLSDSTLEYPPGNGRYPVKDACPGCRVTQTRSFEGRQGCPMLNGRPTYPEFCSANATQNGVINGRCPTINRHQVARGLHGQNDLMVDNSRVQIGHPHHRSGPCAGFHRSETVSSNGLLLSLSYHGNATTLNAFLDEETGGDLSSTVSNGSRGCLGFEGAARDFRNFEGKTSESQAHIRGFVQSSAIEVIPRSESKLEGRNPRSEQGLLALNLTQEQEECTAFDYVAEINGDPSTTNGSRKPQRRWSEQRISLTAGSRGHHSPDPLPILRPSSCYELLDSDDSTPSSSDDESPRTGNEFSRHFRFGCLHRPASTPQPVMGSKRLLSPNRLKSHRPRDLQHGRHIGRSNKSRDGDSIENDRGDASTRSRTLPHLGRGMGSPRSLSDASWFGGRDSMQQGVMALEPLQHRSVVALKLESLNDSKYLRSRPSNGGVGCSDRGSVGTRESDQLGTRLRPGEDGDSCWSLSDSCFETFSGSTPQINDSTVL